MALKFHWCRRWWHVRHWWEGEEATSAVCGPKQAISICSRVPDSFCSPSPNSFSATSIWRPQIGSLPFLKHSETCLVFCRTESLWASDSSFYCKNKIMDINSSILFRADNNGSWQSYISILQGEISCIYLKLVGKVPGCRLCSESVWGISCEKTLFLSTHRVVGSWK